MLIRNVFENHFLLNSLERWLRSIMSQQVFSELLPDFLWLQVIMIWFVPVSIRLQSSMFPRLKHSPGKKSELLADSTTWATETQIKIIFISILKLISFVFSRCSGGQKVSRIAFHKSSSINHFIHEKASARISCEWFGSTASAWFSLMLWARLVNSFWYARSY